MNNKIKKIEEEFYQATSKSSFYINNDFNEAIYRLTNVIDYLFIKEIFSFNLNIASEQDRLRHAYRAMLLKIHEYKNNNDDALNNKSLKKDIKDIIEQTDDSYNFNEIRNCFDRVKAGSMNIELKNNGILFKHNLKRDLTADIYSRWVDHEKPFLSIKTNETLSSENSFKDLMNKKYSKIWDNKKKTPRNKHILHKIADNCYFRMKDELLDIKDNIEFADFTLDEFRKVYSLIQAIGVLKMNQNIFRILKNKNKDYKYDVSPEMKYDDFINSIKDYINIDLAKIETIVNLLIYDYEFQKNKISIYQPIFRVGDSILYSTMLVYHSLPQDKLFYKLLKERKNKRQISYISRLREQLMTDNIISFLESKNKLKCKSNYIYHENGKPKAEYDLLILDKQEQRVAVVELKWYFKNDNEFDVITIDDKLEESIEIRLKRFKIFNDNKKEILKDSFNINDGDLYNSFTFIITENHSGTANLDDKIAIFDRFAFYYAIEKVNYRLSGLNKIIKKDQYLPELPVEIKNIEIKYHGYNYFIPIITYKG